MIWYIMLCIALGLIFLLYRCARTGRRLFVVVSLIMLWVMMSFRATSVGADTRQYEALFNQLREMNLAQVFTGNVLSWNYEYTVRYETAFKLILFFFVKIFFFLPARVCFGLLAFLILLFLHKAIMSQSPYPFLSIFLYVALGFFQTGMNMTQNALSIAIVLWALNFIRNKEPKKWIIAVIVAASIHNSAFVFLPMYWISNWNGKRSMRWIPAFLLILAAFLSEYAVRIIARFVPSAYRTYVLTSRSASSEVLVFLFHIILLIPPCFVILMHRGSPKNESTVRIMPYDALFLVEALLYVLSFTARGLIRVATVFSPALILYLPNLVQQIKNARNRQIILFLVVLLAIVGYIIRMRVNNIGTTQPYEFWLP